MSDDREPETVVMRKGELRLWVRSGAVRVRIVALEDGTGFDLDVDPGDLAADRPTQEDGDG